MDEVNKLLGQTPEHQAKRNELHRMIFMTLLLELLVISMRVKIIIRHFLKELDHG
jgi:hypothetical protein